MTTKFSLSKFHQDTIERTAETVKVLVAQTAAEDARIRARIAARKEAR